MKSNTLAIIKSTWVILTIVFVAQFGLNKAFADSTKANTKYPGKKSKGTGKATTKTNTKSSTYHFIGNTFSNKYHKPDCEFARKMNASHVLFLKSKNEANLSKYKECNWCMPKWTKSVSSKLIKSK